MSSASVSIPIGAIMEEYAAWAEEIVEAAADEALREARKNAQTAFTSRTNRLYKSIKKAKSRHGDNTILVKATDPKAHLIESGHDVRVKKGGEVVGHAAARQFMGQAEEAIRARLPEIINNVVGIPTIEVKK